MHADWSEDAPRPSPNWAEYLDYIDDLVAKIAAALPQGGPYQRALEVLRTCKEPNDPGREDTLEFIGASVTVAANASTDSAYSLHFCSIRSAATSDIS